MKSFVASLMATLMLLAGGAREAVAQDGPADPINKVIWDMFQMHQGKTLCVSSTTTLTAVRAAVLDHLKLGVSDTVNSQTIALALWKLLPCPFSPQRDELRPATAVDVEGSWLFPEGSQKLRVGPRSAQGSPAGPLRVRCDAVGYFPGGELRHAIIAGTPKCPFDKASDLDVARKNPRVSSWSMLRDGRLGVARTDVPNHIEEWDIYAVQTPFVFNDVPFTAGDLVAYVRRENGNEVGAATQFRHLQRLP